MTGGWQGVALRTFRTDHRYPRETRLLYFVTTTPGGAGSRERYLVSDWAIDKPKNARFWAKLPHI